LILEQLSRKTALTSARDGCERRLAVYSVRSGQAEGKAVAKLLDPSEEKREAFLRMAQDWQDWRDHGGDRYGLALEDFEAYLARVDRFRDAAQIPVGWVPGTEFWLDDGVGEIVACVRLRFWLTPSLEVEGGHIGYDVRPSSRGRGFGTAALGLVLPEA
jgi:predicted acetyltransferase